jgi:hypothetical protein
MKKIISFFQEDPITSFVEVLDPKQFIVKINLQEIVFDKGRDCMTSEEEKEFIDNLNQTILDYQLVEDNNITFTIHYSEGFIVIKFTKKDIS